MKYLTFPFLLLLLPLIGFGCSSEEKETGGEKWKPGFL